MSGGQVYRWAKYVGTSGSAWTDAGTFIRSLTLPQVEPATVTTSPLPMPRLVIGQDYYATHVQLNTPTTGTRRLLLEVNHPWYANTQIQTGCKIQVQINGKIPSTGAAGWECMNASTATLLGEWGHYGTPPNNPINTVVLTMAITSGVLVNGNNIYGFRTTTTDGISSGARILKMNVIGADVQLNSCSITSNVITCTSNSAHGWSTSNEIFIYGAPGPYARTATPCGDPFMRGCTSPNTGSNWYDARSTVPTSSDPSDVNYPGGAQPVMYGAQQFIAESDFTLTDYSAFTAPGGGNAVTGADLWANATLVNAGAPGIGYSTVAHCATCHQKDGADLKYFAYENYAIRQRSIFHGLTAAQGDHIAAYIRGLPHTRPAMGYPWSPVYQPGPGTTALAWWDVRAGAGLHSVLTYGNDWTECMAPSGSFTQWRYNGNLPIRDCPDIVQLFDWNHWLPQVYMEDAFPASNFTSSSIFTGYTAAKAAAISGRQTGTITSATPQTLVLTAALACTNGDTLVIQAEAATAASGCGTSSVVLNPRGTNGTTAAAHTDAGVGDFTKWKAGGYNNGFPSPSQSNAYQLSIIPPVGSGNDQAGYTPPAPLTAAAFSLNQWMLVKNAEINQENYTEGMLGLYSTDAFGACSTCPGGAYVTNGWTGTKFFEEAFHRFMINTHQNIFDTFTNAATGNLLVMPGWGCQSNFWYRLQDVNYPGNGNQSGNVPVDIPYDKSFRTNDCSMSGRPTGPNLMLAATLSVQQNIQNANGQPSTLNQFYYLNNLFDFNQYRFATAFMTNAELAGMATEYCNNYLALANSVSSGTWDGWVASPPSGYTTNFTIQDATYPARYAFNGTDNYNFPGNLALVLPIFKYWGVDATTLSNMVSFGNAHWPSINFATQRDSNCSLVQSGGSGPQNVKCTNIP
jgi:hypothetical protein